MTEVEIPEVAVSFQDKCNYHLCEGSSIIMGEEGQGSSIIIGGEKEEHSHRKCSVDNCELDHDIIFCLLNFETDKERMIHDANISGSHDIVIGNLHSNQRFVDENKSVDTKINDSGDVQTVIHDHGLAGQTETLQKGETETSEVQKSSLGALFGMHSAEDEPFPSADSPLHGPLTVSSNHDCSSFRSSAASAQSFVFPILTSDFYESPVKMAQSESRLRFIKKSRQWKKYWFGCWIF
ncbi:unnamed protein product [Cuscuta epithymum]|uniref:Uncharacterized protein n=1 Tax=Cuscuta epithymum TaxID=186058 RepID=A0AAV0DPJ9_9ASTE|nr:unnamed protein product [Cuscuta epithymum]